MQCRGAKNRTRALNRAAHARDGARTQAFQSKVRNRSPPRAQPQLRPGPAHLFTDDDEGLNHFLEAQLLTRKILDCKQVSEVSEGSGALFLELLLRCRSRPV